MKGPTVKPNICAARGHVENKQGKCKACKEQRPDRGGWQSQCAKAGVRKDVWG